MPSSSPFETTKSKMGMMLRLLAATVLHRRSISCGKTAPCCLVTRYRLSRVCWLPAVASTVELAAVEAQM